MSDSDFVIVGGGTAGCALASRLKQYLPHALVTLIEAGPDEHKNPLITEPFGGFALSNTPLKYNYTTVPQKHYDGRTVYNTGGRMLSGSSACNYGGWVRGSRDDYDTWSAMVDDKRWSYNGMLPYLKKTESHHDPKADPQHHGLEGPFRTTGGARTYPLGKLFVEALKEGTGLPSIPDANCGDPIGVAHYTENWTPEGKRQPSGAAYQLQGVNVITDAPVQRIIIENGVAKGVELVDGRKIVAQREVVVSCGAIRSPQILMLSGIGPSEELSKFGIQEQVASPNVGIGLNDHCTIGLLFKIKNADKGLAAGSPLWNDPSYTLGMAVDVVATKTASLEPLKQALLADGEAIDGHPLLKPTRAHYEVIPAYAPTVAPGLNIDAPFDGSIVTLSALNLLPTSRGSVRLSSASATDDPIIDPNYYATHADRTILREAIRDVFRVVESPPGQQIVEAEVPPEGYPVLSSQSSDEEIDRRVKRAAACWYHNTGTCAMGKVVDADLKVLGAKNLRVVDASVIPTPIAAPTQFAVYALAEQAAAIISDAYNGKA